MKKLAMLLVSFLVGGCGANAVAITRQVRVAGAPVGVRECGVQNDSDFAIYGDERSYLLFCLEVLNATRGPLRVDRHELRLVARGLELTPSAEQRIVEIDAQTDEQLRVRFVSDELKRGEEVEIAFRHAITSGGSALEVPPLRYRVR